MAVFAVYIEKETSYTGETRRLGNTYHYQTAAGQTFDDADVATFIKDQEVQITSADVDFVGWTTWGPTDGPAINNVIRDSGTFNEPGQGGLVPGMYAENCALVVQEISRSPVLNRRRWLRKFIRLAAIPGAGYNDSVLRGTAELDPAVRQALEDYLNAVSDVPSGGGSVFLSTENGDGISNGLGSVCRPYLITRQIGE